MAGTVGAPLLVGAFEPDAWAGLVLVLPGRGSVALRLAAEVGGARVESADWFWLVHEVGPHAPDGSYARVSFDLSGPLPPTRDAPIRAVTGGEASLVWEWARVGRWTVVAHARSARPLRLFLDRRHPPPRPGDAAAADFSIAVFPRGADSAPLSIEAEGSCGFDLAAGDELTLVVCVGGTARVPALPALPPARDRRLAARAYARRRVEVSGAWDGLAASVANNVHWMVSLQPEHARRYVPAGRRWIFPGPHGGRDDWTIFAWDGFFNALLLSLESPELAREMVDAVLATQYASGNVPNWRSRHGGTPDRSQPPVGAFLVLSVALRLADPAFAQRALPALEAWHAWWSAPVRGRPRRMRPSGLYAWGSDVELVPGWTPAWERGASHRQKAAWESGQDDLPNWDDAAWDEERSTLALECVDLSALLALDAECLAWLHEFAGDAARGAAYRDEHARLSRLVNERLWDETRGVYADRREDGGLSPRVAASNFLPVLAGLVPPERLPRTLAVLLDPERFWGPWIVPTIARDDPAFADQQYWRGTIWPPMNYLLYQGLRRARADAAAAALADRSAALFVGDWRRHQLCRENFSSVDGTGGGQRHQSWGPLFAWTALCEFADVTPWDGLRLGASSVRAASGVRRLRVGGHAWDVALGPDAMWVACDGEPWFAADGPVCLRHVQVSGGAWRGDAEVSRPVRLRVAGAPEPARLLAPGAPVLISNARRRGRHPAER